MSRNGDDKLHEISGHLDDTLATLERTLMYGEDGECVENIDSSYTPDEREEKRGAQEQVLPKGHSSDRTIKNLQKKIKELKEQLQLKDAEIATYKEDFNKEREDRNKSAGKAYALQDEVAKLKCTLEAVTIQQKKDYEKFVVLSDELNAAKEEIAVKVAQVKQYQKQVEAYKQQMEACKPQVSELSQGETAGDRAKQHNHTVRPQFSGEALIGPAAQRESPAAADLCGGVGGCPDRGGRQATDQEDLPLPIVFHHSSTFPHKKLWPAQGGDGRLGSTSETTYDVVTTSKDEGSLQNVPEDPNLTCPVCCKKFRKGQIQKYRRHADTCQAHP